MGGMILGREAESCRISVLSDPRLLMCVMVIKHNHHRIQDNQKLNTDENAFAFETSISHSACGLGMVEALTKNISQIKNVFNVALNILTGRTMTQENNISLGKV